MAWVRPCPWPSSISFSLSLCLSVCTGAHSVPGIFVWILCFYHLASAAVHCHDYFAWLSLLAHLLGDRPSGNTWLQASCGICAPVREWGGWKEIRGGKSFILKARGLLFHETTTFLISRGSYYVFPCLWACDCCCWRWESSWSKSHSTCKDSQDRGITLQTSKETPSLKLHIPVYPKTMKA